MKEKSDILLKFRHITLLQITDIKLYYTIPITNNYSAPNVHVTKPSCHIAGDLLIFLLVEYRALIAFCYCACLFETTFCSFHLVLIVKHLDKFLSVFVMAERSIKEAAEEKTDYRILGKIAGMDLRAREARYHESCRRSYVPAES